MEGKTVILSVLVLLIMIQIEVEAEVCFRTSEMRDRYDRCRSLGESRTCCSACNGDDNPYMPDCGGPYPYGSENSGDDVNEYCKLGCASACGTLTTLQTSEASEIVNGAVEECTKACSTLCSKGSLAVDKAHPRRYQI